MTRRIIPTESGGSVFQHLLDDVSGNLSEPLSRRDGSTFRRRIASRGTEVPVALELISVAAVPVLAAGISYQSVMRGEDQLHPALRLAAGAVIAAAGSQPAPIGLESNLEDYASNVEFRVTGTMPLTEFAGQLLGAFGLALMCDAASQMVVEAVRRRRAS